MTGCIYIIRSAAGGVKVGRSATPMTRLKALQSANPAEITLCHLTEERADAAAIERAAHGLLRDKRLQGEWFDVSIDVAIEAVERAISTIDEAQRGYRPQEDEEKLSKPFPLRLQSDLLELVDGVALRIGKERSAAIRMLLREALKNFKD